MKGFIQIMLLGMQMLSMSCTSIIFFVGSYFFIDNFLNAKGFAALFYAILIIAGIFCGFFMIFILGIVADAEVKTNETLD